MIKKMFALAALAGALLSPLASHAALVALTPADGWPPVGSKGLSGVLFNTASAGDVKVALGAHPYTSGVTMPNDGVSVFQGQPGLANPLRARWSFDFVYDVRSCADCKIFLGIDTNPGAGTNFVDIDLLSAPFSLPKVLAESWNLEMAFLTAGYDFNPFGPSSTDFRLYVLDAAGAFVVGTDITVNVPEPASLALAGVALAGLAMSRRRRV